jgi:hypothetical protein
VGRFPVQQASLQKTFENNFAAKDMATRIELHEEDCVAPNEKEVIGTSEVEMIVD